MTIEERVAAHLESIYPESETNAGLARAVNAKEPSVRRATANLARRGIVWANYDASPLGTNIHVRYSRGEERV